MCMTTWSTHQACSIKEIHTYMRFKKQRGRGLSYELTVGHVENIYWRVSEHTTW